MSGKISGYGSAYSKWMDLLASVRAADDSMAEFRDVVIELFEAQAEHEATVEKLNELQECYDSLKCDWKDASELHEQASRERDEAQDAFRQLNHDLVHVEKATLLNENDRLRAELRAATRTINELHERTFAATAADGKREAEYRKREKQFHEVTSEYECALRMFKDGDHAFYLATRTANVNAKQLEIERLESEIAGFRKAASEKPSRKTRARKMSVR